MKHVEAAMLTMVVVGFVWVLWHLWRSRQTELLRAERNAELAQLSRTMEGIAHDEALAQELMRFCQDNLSKYKCPRSIDFDPALPRLPTGKLYKRLLRDRYWGNKTSRIV